MRTLLKTKNGKTEKKERGKERRKRERETGTCALSMGLPTGVYFAMHPAAMRPACGEINVGEGGMYTRG